MKKVLCCCWVVLLAVFAVSDGFGQERSARPTRVNLYLQHLIDHPTRQYEDIHLVVRGDVDQIRARTVELGGHFKYRFRDYAAILLPIHRIPALVAESYVERLEAGMGNGQPLNDQSLLNNNVLPIHQGLAPLPEAYDGEGVIMGFIDSGIELNHPDFQLDSTGRTRVLMLWDQTLPFNAQLTPGYGYGQVWDSAQINAGISNHLDQVAFFGHGSNVTGIGAGNGRGGQNTQQDYKGVAPKADLVVVSSNFSANNWTLTIADAVDFIFKVADSLNRPCVINASLGTYIGSHDGQDAAALIIDSLILDKPGRAMVCAAGNSGGEDPYHLRMDVDADTSFSWFQYNPTSGFGFGAVYFELWADTADMNGVSFAMGADKVTGGFSFRGNMPFDNIQNRLNQVVFDTIFGAGGHTIGTVQTWAEEINGRYFMQVLMPQPDSNQYFYRMMATGDGAFDVWSGSWLATSDMVFSGLPGVATFPDIAHYVLPDIQQSIVSSWACSPHVITVGNYTNRNSYLDVDSNLVTFPDDPGEISPNSSWGPARTGVLKPDVAAPGDISVTSGKLDHLTNLLAAPSLRPRVGLGGMHYRNGGTSMASPGVAGIAALYFQKCPQASAADIRQALTGTASTDGFTGTVPNFQWGYGKANGFDALVGSNFSAPTVSANDGFCTGDSLELSVPGNYLSVLWSNGDTGATTFVDAFGIYQAELVNLQGCRSTSDPLNIFEYPLPPKPALTPSGTATICEGETLRISVPDEFGAYAWNSGANTHYTDVATAGSYAVEVTNSFACTNVSDTLLVNVLPAPPVPVITQNGDSLIAGPASGWQWYQNGTELSGATNQSLVISASGTYQVEVTGTNGCTTISEPIFLVATSTGEARQQTSTFSIFPNPGHGQYTVAWEALPGTFQLSVRNVLGQSVVQRTIAHPGGLQQWPLDITGQPAGMYLLVLEQGDTRKTIKIVYH